MIKCESTNWMSKLQSLVWEKKAVIKSIRVWLSGYRATSIWSTVFIEFAPNRTFFPSLFLFSWVQTHLSFGVEIFMLCKFYCKQQCNKIFIRILHRMQIYLLHIPFIFNFHRIIVNVVYIYLCISMNIVSVLWSMHNFVRHINKKDIHQW